MVNRKNGEFAWPGSWVYKQLTRRDTGLTKREAKHRSVEVWVGNPNKRTWKDDNLSELLHTEKLGQ